MYSNLIIMFDKKKKLTVVASCIYNIVYNSKLIMCDYVAYTRTGWPKSPFPLFAHLYHSCNIYKKAAPHVPS